MPYAAPVNPSAACPECRSALVSHPERVPWCPACEWNLDAYDPVRRRAELGWGRVDRATYRLAYRLTRGQFAALRGRPVGRPGWGLARVTMVAAAGVLVAVLIGCVALGVVLIAYRFPSMTILPGLVLVLFAVVLRPRLGRLDNY